MGVSSTSDLDKNNSKRPFQPQGPITEKFLVNKKATKTNLTEQFNASFNA